jgi:hypothetical protein
MAFEDVGFLGALNGGSALGVLITSVLIGVYILIKGTRLKAKLLQYAGIMIILIGLLWLGPSTDFLMLLFTGANISPQEIYAYLSYLWVAPAIFIAMLIGTELIAPNRKKAILIFIGIVGIIFEIGLIFFPFEGQTFEYKIEAKNIIDTSFNPLFFSFYALAIILLFVVIFNGFGSIQKARESTGILRQKFIFLALGFIIFPIAAVFDTLVPPGVALPFVRITVVITGILLYLGLKP